MEGARAGYRVVGVGPLTPLVPIHGGPGNPSYSLVPLRDFERADRLHELDLAVLFTVGGHDEVASATAYVRVIREFLHRVAR